MAAQTVSICKFVGTVSLGIATVRSSIAEACFVDAAAAPPRACELTYPEWRTHTTFLYTQKLTHRYRACRSPSHLSPCQPSSPYPPPSTPAHPSPTSPPSPPRSPPTCVTSPPSPSSPHTSSRLAALGTRTYYTRPSSHSSQDLVWTLQSV